MHWGTFPMTDEPILEPVERLREACTRKGLQDGEFVAVEHGQMIVSSSGEVVG